MKRRSKCFSNRLKNGSPSEFIKLYKQVMFVKNNKPLQFNTVDSFHPPLYINLQRLFSDHYIAYLVVEATHPHLGKMEPTNI